MNIRIKPWSWTISTLKAKSSLLKEEFYEIYKLSFQQGAIANNFSYPVTFWYFNLNLPWVVFCNWKWKSDSFPWGWRCDSFVSTLNDTVQPV